MVLYLLFTYQLILDSCRASYPTRPISPVSHCIHPWLVKRPGVLLNFLAPLRHFLVYPRPLFLRDRPCTCMIGELSILLCSWMFLRGQSEEFLKGDRRRQNEVKSVRLDRVVFVWNVRWSYTGTTVVHFWAWCLLICSVLHSLLGGVSERCLRASLWSLRCFDNEQ